MDYSSLVPYELGESGDIQAVDYLVNYLIHGTSDEKRLSASAIRKLSKLYLEKCNLSKPYLLKNLDDEHPQVRQYTLKALLNLELSDDELIIIENVYRNDDYNKDISKKILLKYKVNIKDISNKTNRIKCITEYNKPLPNDNHYLEKIREKYKILNISNEEFNNYYYLENELNDELIEEYVSLAEEFADLFLQGLHEIKMSEREKKILELRYNFYGDRLIRLETIGNEYNISRERVRQIFIKAYRKLTDYYRRNKNDELVKLKTLINYLVRPDEIDFDKRLILFLIYGFQPRNTAILLKLLTELIKGNKFIDDVSASYFEFIENSNRRAIEDKRILRENKTFIKKVADKVQWFGRITILKEQDYINISPVRDVNENGEGYSGEYYSNKMKKIIQYESLTERNFLLFIEKSNKVIFYTVQPFKIAYHYLNHRSYTPDVFLVLEDGRGIVVEIKPLFNMAIHSNLIKYYVLKKYCEELGFGMLVTDNRISIEELKNYYFNSSFEKELLEELRNGPIYWHKMLELKDKFNIGYKEVESVVIRNNLYYDKNPFVIAMSKNNKKV